MLTLLPSIDCITTDLPLYAHGEITKNTNVRGSKFIMGYEDNQRVTNVSLSGYGGYTMTWTLSPSHILQDTYPVGQTQLLAPRMQLIRRLLQLRRLQLQLLSRWNTTSCSLHGAFLELSWSHPGAFLEPSWSIPGAFLEPSWSLPGAIPGAFLEPSSRVFCKY